VARIQHPAQGDRRFLQPVQSLARARSEVEAEGLVLVDTGIGLGDIAAPRERLGAGFVAIARPRLRARESPGA
jgi:isopentenyl diphosphate isomerase/L-lactate dehydrogenase-like FMN-dependent dehydrogenase